MIRRPPRRPGADIPGQLSIDWNAAEPRAASEPANAAAADMSAPAPALVQRLPWDFENTFPEPMPAAIDAGLINEEDAAPENVRAIHDEHAREGLVVLHDLDAVLDARIRGVDPRTNKPPKRHQARERLGKFFETEPARLEHWWQTLMDTYEEVFGPEAADAFAKAIRARHAGIPVIAELPAVIAPTPAAVPPEAPAEPRTPKPVRHPRRIAARLPVPKPLPSAIAAGHFGQEESGKPVRPGVHEVRAITEQHAETLIELLDGLQQVETWLSSAQCSDRARLYHERDALLRKVQSGIAAYAEDFGPYAAEQLEAYVRRQAALDPARRHER